MPEVSIDDLFEAITLVYRRWAEEYALLKKTKKEKDDGSTDWLQFHNIRLVNHTKAERKWKSLLERLTALLPRQGLGK